MTVNPEVKLEVGETLAILNNVDFHDAKHGFWKDIFPRSEACPYPGKERGYIALYYSVYPLEFIRDQLRKLRIPETTF